MEDLPGDGYDYYVAGSDQVWNQYLPDADEAYFLPFVKSGKKVAYAPSFGPSGQVPDNPAIREYLQSFDSLSVREEVGQKIIASLTGQEVPILLDPTLLTEKQDWAALDIPRVQAGNYIFFHTYWADPYKIRLLQKIARSAGCKTVVAPYFSTTYLRHPLQVHHGMKFRVRPYISVLESLNLIKNAKLVVTTSFHATAFSIIFERPFLCIDGLKDERLSNLLRMTGMTARAVNAETVDEVCRHLYDIDFSAAKDSLRREKETSLAYLKTALDMQ